MQIIAEFHPEEHENLVVSQWKSILGDLVFLFLL